MAKFLGEKIIINTMGTPYEKYQPADWAMEYINAYGGIDGEHHKAWVLDQVARILKGTHVLLSLAKWDDGNEEYRFQTGRPTLSYLTYVAKVKEEGYKIDVGIAP